MNRLGWASQSCSFIVNISTRVRQSQPAPLKIAIVVLSPKHPTQATSLNICTFNTTQTDHGRNAGLIRSRTKPRPHLFFVGDFFRFRSHELEVGELAENLVSLFLELQVAEERFKTGGAQGGGNNRTLEGPAVGVWSKERTSGHLANSGTYSERSRKPVAPFRLGTRAQLTLNRHIVLSSIPGEQS